MEQPPNAEEIREAYIIDELKSVSVEQMMRLLQGPPDPANAVPAEQQKELHAWIDEDEIAREKLEEGSHEWAEHIVEFEIKRADLYNAAEHTALERITLEDVLPLAEQYGLDNAVVRIQARLVEISSL